MTKPASPGKGYRWLKPKEIVSQGDEFRKWSGRWLKARSVGTPALFLSFYRRKITKRKSTSKPKRQ